MKNPPVTVIETPEFIASLARLMDNEEREALIDFLAWNPAAGKIVPGSGGVRKLRWALEGRGKRGGARVIYFFYNETMPLFALTAYAKNEQADLSDADKNDLRRLTKLLVESWSKER